METSKDKSCAIVNTTFYTGLFYFVAQVVWVLPMAKWETKSIFFFLVIIAYVILSLLICVSLWNLFKYVGNGNQEGPTRQELLTCVLQFATMLLLFLFLAQFQYLFYIAYTIGWVTLLVAGIVDYRSKHVINRSILTLLTILLFFFFITRFRFVFGIIPILGWVLLFIGGIGYYKSKHRINLCFLTWGIYVIVSLRCFGLMIYGE